MLIWGCYGKIDSATQLARKNKIKLNHTNRILVLCEKSDNQRVWNIILSRLDRKITIRCVYNISCIICIQGDSQISFEILIPNSLGWNMPLILCFSKCVPRNPRAPRTLRRGSARDIFAKVRTMISLLVNIISLVIQILAYDVHCFHKIF